MSNVNNQEDIENKNTIEEPVAAQVAEQPLQVSQPVTVPRKRRMRRIVAAIIVIVGCVAAGYFLSLQQQNNSNEVTQRPQVTEDGNKVITQEEEAIANVVAKVSPSVVSIVTRTTTESRFSGVSRASEGAGTGIIVGADGYILTNKHVIDGAQDVKVVLTDGTSYSDVSILGSDPINDIAFLKIKDASGLPVAELGDSTSIRVGQRVVAIGNSLGLYQNTVTSGIVSGTGRPIIAGNGEDAESLSDLIQTDAAINPGNSGGPLLNLQGQVIGINTAIIEDAQGIGFSIPIGATKGLLKSVLRGDGVKRAYLGVSYIPVTADIANDHKLSTKQGAYVYSGTQAAPVVPNSPAAKAGIKAGDVITKVGDIEVGTRGGVASLIAEYAPGDTVEVTILRDGKTRVVKVTLETFRSENQ